MANVAFSDPDGCISIYSDMKIAHWSKRSWIGHAETGYRLRSGEGAPSSEECTSIYAFRMQCDQMWPKRGGVVAPGLSITNWASPMVLSANPPSQ